jgi:LemA protein
MGILIIIVGLLLWYTIKTYNRVKPLEISVRESESNIGIILQKRESILDKLNDVVNSYSKYEKDIVERLSDDMKANTDSTIAINRLYDAYPDLKLNDTFSNLVDRLYTIESERQQTTEYYNSQVKYYNEAVTSFPAIIICSMISFKEKTFFNS